MADDDEGAKPASHLAVEHPAATGAVKPSADAAPQTEWTVSDRRGPLGSAADDEIERFAPAYEMDAEGGADAITHDPAHQPSGSSNIGSGSETHDSHLGSTETSTPAPAIEQAASSDAPSTSTAPAADPEGKRSLLPVAAGLVIGAMIGAGSAWLVYSQANGGTGDAQQLAALSSKVDALDKRQDPGPEVAKLQSGLSDLQRKVAALESRSLASSGPGNGGTSGGAKQSPAPSSGQADTSAGAAASQATATAGTALAGKVAALQAALDKVQARTSAIQAQDAKQEGAVDKVAALQSGVADAQKQAAGTQSALDAVKTEQKQLGDKIAGLTIAVAGALKKAEGAETDAATVQTQQKVLEGKLGSPALAVVADSLVQQIRAGQPFARQVDALAALNADPAKISVLRENAAHGVPSAQALLTRWKPLADPVIATGNSAPAGANFGQRLEHGLFGLVSVRRADGTSGNDLASKVNLIEADLAHDDVTGAFGVWQSLPASAKAKSGDWGALAKTSVEALTAARNLQHSAIDALGAKKS